VSFGPEEIEEEGCAEDEGDKYAGEDVERRDSDKVIIVDIDSVVEGCHVFLAIDVVWGLGQHSNRSLTSRINVNDCATHLPDNADVPSDSETTQKMSAHWYTMNFVRRR